MRFFYKIIFLLVSIGVFSQNRLSDKEFKALEEKSRSYVNSFIDSSFYYAEKIEISSKTEHIAFAKGIKAYIYQIKRDTILSNKNYKLAFDIINKSKKSKEKIRIESLLYNYAGLINWKRNKLNDALTFFNEGKILSISINDKVQEIKFNNNISLVYSEIGKYDLAISISRQSNELTDKIKKEYTLQQFFRNKSNINFNLGNYYQKYYNLYRKNTKLLDSSKYFYEKTLYYSEGSLLNKISANISLANILYFKGDLETAETKYLSTLGLVKENHLEENFLNLIYNLGDLYFTKKEYDKAILYFKKVDSIYLLDTSKNNIEFVMSNYNQSIIYDNLKDHEKATFHSDVFLKENQKHQKILINEALLIDSSKEIEEAKIEILKIKNRNQWRIILSWIIKIVVGIFILFLLIYILKISKEKKKINIKIEKLIAESNLRKLNENKTLIKEIDNQSICIDKDKEIEIIDKLNLLESKKYFLSQDFNQHNVAKKIKTNTTYLSYVVNKNFNKSFSEYSNELKINYIIDELINNQVCRKYSTQALAESIGYKNANSFTKSFKKRAGVSPAQFIKKLEL